MDKILIAWDNFSLRSELVELLRRQYDITLCADGKTALELMERLQPTVAILDLGLPELDGVTLVERAITFLPPITFCITDFYNDYVVQALQDMGVGYVFRRPCQPRSILARLEDFRARLAANAGSNNRVTVTQILLSLHFAPHTDGFLYLKMAIPLYRQDPSQLLCKEIYGAVVQVYGLSGWKVVEHSIRNAIQNAWNADPDAWKIYFPNHTSAPSNKAFISRICEILNDL